MRRQRLASSLPISKDSGAQPVERERRRRASAGTPVQERASAGTTRRVPLREPCVDAAVAQRARTVLSRSACVRTTYPLPTPTLLPPLLFPISSISLPDCQYRIGPCTCRSRCLLAVQFYGRQARAYEHGRRRRLTVFAADSRYSAAEPRWRQVFALAGTLLYEGCAVVCF